MLAEVNTTFHGTWCWHVQADRLPRSGKRATPSAISRMIRSFSISFNVNFRRIRDVFGLGRPLSKDFTGVRTSSRRYLWRRHLGFKMAAPEMTSTKTWGAFFDPYCGGGGKWRPFRFRPPSWMTSFAEQEMRSSKMATGSGRAAIFRRRRNRDRKTPPILLMPRNWIREENCRLSIKRMFSFPWYRGVQVTVISFIFVRYLMMACIISHKLIDVG